MSLALNNWALNKRKYLEYCSLSVSMKNEILGTFGIQIQMCGELNISWGQSFKSGDKMANIVLRKTLKNVLKPLNCQSQQLSSALSSACDFTSHFCKQCGNRLLH